MLAAEQGHENVAALLLAKGADVNAPPHFGETALTLVLEWRFGVSRVGCPCACACHCDAQASWGGWLEIVSLLLHKASNGLRLVRFYCSVFVLFCAWQGADVNVKQSTGYTPLLLAARRCALLP